MVGNMRTFVTDRQTDRRTYRLTEVVSWLPRDSKKILVQERMHIQVAQLIGKWGDFKSSGEDAKNVSKCVKKFFSATSWKSILAKIWNFRKIFENRQKNLLQHFKKLYILWGWSPPPQKFWISWGGGVICQIFHLWGDPTIPPQLKTLSWYPLKANFHGKDS